MFSTRDLFLVVGMVFAIIMMNAFFMHAGIQGDEYQESQMPELDLTAAQVDITPSATDERNPGSPSQGYISPDETQEGAYDSNSWIRKDEYFVQARDDTDYTTISLRNASEISALDTVQLENESDTGTLSGEGFTVDVTLTEKTGNITNDGVWIVRYTIDQQPTTDSGWMSSVPIVGGLYDSGNQLASFVGWIGALIYYAVTWVIGGFISVIGSIGILAFYIVQLLMWIGTTYSALVGSAPGWSSLIVAVPGIVVSLEALKGLIAVVGASNWI